MSVVLLSIGFLFFSIQFISTTTYTCDPTISCGCSALSTVVTSRIVGGEIASNDTWAWMLSLQLSGAHTCGASLLTPEYAVTAGHCVVDFLNTPSKLSILAGTNYLYDTSNTTAQQRTVIQITRHPNYNSEHVTNDIAILQFSPLNISSNSNIASICLPNANQDPFQTGSNLVVIGWGITSQGSYSPSSYLRQVTVQAIAPKAPSCLQSGLTDSSVQFCAGTSTGGKGKLFIDILHL
jgi:secreted trypsin-like serine protease